MPWEVALGCWGVSKAAHEGGSQALYIIPKALATCYVIGDTAGEVKIVSSMHERNAEMLDNTDTFIVLPEGFGTFEELLKKRRNEALFYSIIQERQHTVKFKNSHLYII
ncbi:hypothetical protein LWI29_004749 [Acer saccharum]|uniref:cytokinin riboside 5'-monophosphate phosphoribohydrolase n=1 Tax=Acer saccharum TaxID=4024 RepID=A0AA39W0U6_ACESA|nr:hypothetical protein LWI29_004749 [Acer saccharum]